MKHSDLVRIEKRYKLNEESMASLLWFYQALIGNDALVLYQGLALDRGDDKKIEYFLSFYNLSIDNFESLINKLNQYRLILTYQNEEYSDRYILVINKPLSPTSFLKHEVYPRLLIKEIGQEEYNKRISQLNQINVKGYKDITKQLDYQRLYDWTSEQESSLQNNKKEDYTSFFDIEKFVSECSPLLFPINLRTSENLKTISQLADIYNVSQSKMRDYLSRSINDNGELDKKLLRKYCMNIRDNAGITKENEYRVPCALYLSSLQEGVSLTPNDRELLANLSEKYHLNPEVINVLLQYSYRRCNKRLIHKFIYQIASDLHRQSIEDWQSALNYFNNTQNSNSKEVLPNYENTNNPKVSSEELDDFLKRWNNGN